MPKSPRCVEVDHVDMDWEVRELVEDDIAQPVPLIRLNLGAKRIIYRQFVIKYPDGELVHLERAVFGVVAESFDGPNERRRSKGAGKCLECMSFMHWNSPNPLQWYSVAVRYDVLTLAIDGDAQGIGAEISRVVDIQMYSSYRLCTFRLQVLVEKIKVNISCCDVDMYERHLSLAPRLESPHVPNTSILRWGTALPKRMHQYLALVHMVLPMRGGIV
jgi:hypothetical protein